VGTIDLDMVKLLKDAGARGVAIGIEHGNENFRKDVLKRNITDQQIIATIKLCEERGIKDNYGQIMIGLPFEDKELFLDTVRLCRRLNIRYFSYIFSPYPATEFGSLCEKNNWLPVQEDYFERQEAVIDYPAFKKDDIQLCYDLFDNLAYFKFLPLRIPLVSTGMLLRFYNFIIKIITTGARITYSLKDLLRRAKKLYNRYLH
jgi:radical SAM superfamily enzyme YgiQ (UPF0313 family)